MAQNETKRDTCLNGCIGYRKTCGVFLTCSKRMRVLELLILSVIYFTAFPGFLEALNKNRRCFNKDDDFTKLARCLLKRTRRHHFRNAAPVDLSPTESQPKMDCSKLKLDSSGPDSNRSVSPWRLRNNHDAERYPVDISVAECLCEGCIINGKENRSYNSVPVMYSTHVLKKVICPNNSAMYSFKVLSVRMPIACTCVLPRSYPNLS